ncbi:MAG: FMN-binding protein [Candidatus Eiseniibacteriota bacterium]
MASLTRWFTAPAAFALAALLWHQGAAAEVFHSRESALRLAFPEADRVTPQDLVLSGEEAARVRNLAGAEPPSRLVTAYAGWAGEQCLGWAFLDTHTVRTLPETILVVVDPSGRVRGTHLLAFHEPPEYQPGTRWLAAFSGHELTEHLRTGGSVDGISGSTLSANAVTAAVRRVLAVWSVRLAPGTLAPPEPIP